MKLMTSEAIEETFETLPLESHSLDANSIRFIGRRMDALRQIEAELQGAISLLLEQNNLKGQWELDWPNRTLVRKPPQGGEGERP